MAHEHCSVQTKAAGRQRSPHGPSWGSPEPAGPWCLPGTLSLRPQVSTAEVADAASYMCVAENPAGSSEKLFTLRVQGEPG